MTLAELKDMIEDMEIQYGEAILDVEVYGEYDYGDICHTRALASFRSMILTLPEQSAYSRSGKALAVDAEDYQEGRVVEGETVIALSNAYI